MGTVRGALAHRPFRPIGVLDSQLFEVTGSGTVIAIYDTREVTHGHAKCISQCTLREEGLLILPYRAHSANGQ